ncbi:MAG TPA: class C beta-lactamase-related serine hydrolase [Saprospiraceae bacterium]|nr:class C beta-lactamase-related serine hydrolase [Saprospiraceae bacterium]
MRFKYYFLFFLTLIVLGCSTMQPGKGLVNSRYSSDFQKVIDSIYARHPDMIGLMVAIEAPDKNLSWVGAVGYSNYETKQKLKVNQPGLIASNTKTFVSVAILRLIEDGKLGLYAPIENLLSEKTKMRLKRDKYDLKAIKVVHLLSHSSGIRDYVDEDYLKKISGEPTHRWTRDEQIERATRRGKPLAGPGKVFSYADVNYLLLTEIIEQKTKKPFYQAIRELLNYRQNHLRSIWFATLEDAPTQVLPLVHQYDRKEGWDSYDIDVSFDLYGGGGIAATPRDLARFSQLLFEKKIIKDSETFNLIFTDVGVPGNKHGHYYLGLSESEINGHKAYGHGGFWGTTVQYFPDFNASISVFVLNRNQGKLRPSILEALVKELSGSY